MKLRIIHLLGICFCTMLCFAQPKKTIDSLETLLSQAKQEEKISILGELSELQINTSPKKAFALVRNAQKIAKQLQNKDLQSQAELSVGILFLHISEFDSALVYVKRAEALSSQSKQKALIYDNYGKLYKELSKYNESLSYYHKAIQVKKTLNDLQGTALTFNNIGNVYFQMKQYEQAISYYNKSLELRKKTKDNLAIAALFNNIGDSYKNLRLYDKALQSLNASLAIQKEMGNQSGIAHSLHSIGNFYFQLKIYDKAQEYYSKALEIRILLQNKNDIAASRFNIATVHRDLGNYKEAIKYYGMALELREETNNKEAQALTLTAIGGVYKNRKQYKLAIYNYTLALQMHQEMGSNLNIANSYERLGIVYKDTSLYTQAEEFYNKALAIYTSIGNSIDAARIHNYIGNVYREQNKFTEAIAFYKKSYELYNNLNDKSGMAYVSNNLGDLFMKKNDVQQAISNYTKSKDLAQNCKDKNLIQTTSYALYTAYKTKKEFSKSLQFYEEYAAIKDSIAHDKNIQRIAELEFETNLKLLETINENQELKLQEEHSKKLEFKLYLTVALGLLLGIVGFAFLLYKHYSQKKKALYLLTEKSDELAYAYSELESVNTTLQDKNEKISDSLSYAKRIQKAILPSDELIQQAFPKHFIYYEPKEKVSGDFYWFAEHKDFTFFAVVDCTGHGIPGAFMSMVGNTLLNQIVNEFGIIEPHEILNKLDKEIIKTLRQYDEHTKQEDGMEISLIRYDKRMQKLIFAGAGHKIYIIQNSEMTTVSSSVFSIGGMHSIKQDRHIVFEEEEIPIVPGMRLYMFSDGYIDQFGSEMDERFTSPRFQNMLLTIQEHTMEDQYSIVSDTFENWKKSRNQIDDVLVVGIEF